MQKVSVLPTRRPRRSTTAVSIEFEVVVPMYKGKKQIANGVMHVHVLPVTAKDESNNKFVGETGMRK